MADDKPDIVDYATPPPPRPKTPLSEVFLTLVFGAFFLVAALFAVRFVISLFTGR